MEPELWSEENIAKAKEFDRLFDMVRDYQRPEEFMADREAIAGEDESFREHVKQHIEKWNALGDDPYWNFDERIHNFISKVFEWKTSKSNSMKV